MSIGEATALPQTHRADHIRAGSTGEQVLTVLLEAVDEDGLGIIRAMELIHRIFG